MKFFLSILILTIVVATSNQTKKKVIFIFDLKAKNTSMKNQYYVIDDFTFREIGSITLKKYVNLKSVQSDIKTVAEFKRIIEGKPYPEIFSKFKFFIYKPASIDSGCLIEVEKVWLVEEKIEN